MLRQTCGHQCPQDQFLPPGVDLEVRVLDPLQILVLMEDQEDNHALLQEAEFQMAVFTTEVLFQHLAEHTLMVMTM